MLEGGEDPRFIARRMVILACEDVGNADPQALRSRRRRRRRSSTSACRGPVRARAGGDLPVPGAEVGRRKPAHRRGARHVRDHGAEPPRPTCPPLIRARPSSAAARATTTRTAGRVTSRPRSCCPPDVVGTRFYEPGEAEAALRGAWKRSAARGAGSLASPWRRPQPLHSSSPSARPPARDSGRWRWRARARSPLRSRRPRAVQPLWATLRLGDRARYMARAAQAVIDEFDELADLIVAEQGRPRAEVGGHGAARGGRDAAVAGRARARHPGRREDPVLAHPAPGQARALDLRAARGRRRPRSGERAVRHAAGRRRRGAHGRQRRRPQALAATCRCAASGSRASSPAPACPRACSRVVHGHTDAGAALVSAPVAQIRFTGTARAGREVGEACARAPQALGALAQRQGRHAGVRRRRRPRARCAARRGRGSPTRASAAARTSACCACRRSMNASSPGWCRPPSGCAWATRRTRRPRSGLVDRERVARCALWSTRPSAQGAKLHCGGAPQGETHFAPAVLSGGDVGDAPRARGGARAGAGGRGGRVGSAGRRARQRDDLRARCVGVDGRPLQGRAHRAASCAWGWCG